MIVHFLLTNPETAAKCEKKENSPGINVCQEQIWSRNLKLQHTWT